MDAIHYRGYPAITRRYLLVSRHAIVSYSEDIDPTKDYIRKDARRVPVSLVLVKQYSQQDKKSSESASAGTSIWSLHDDLIRSVPFGRD